MGLPHSARPARRLPWGLPHRSAKKRRAVIRGAIIWTRESHMRIQLRAGTIRLTANGARRHVRAGRKG